MELVDLRMESRCLRVDRIVVPFESFGIARRTQGRCRTRTYHDPEMDIDRSGRYRGMVRLPPYGISRDAGQVACGQRRRAADSPALSCRRRVPQSRQLRRGRQRLAGRGEQHENRGLVG